MEKDQINRSQHLIVIGGSSGSLDAILKILSHLDVGFSIPIVIVVHRNPTAGEVLASILAAKTNLLVKEADEKENILKGHIYLAPPDYHLLIETDYTLSLDASEKINYSRPSIDVTFYSAADVYVGNLTCVLLSGANADGTEGMDYAKQMGAKIIVQDPLDASVSYMPQHAIAKVPVDGIFDTKGIANFLNKLKD